MSGSDTERQRGQPEGRKHDDENHVRRETAVWTVRCQTERTPFDAAQTGQRTDGAQLFAILAVLGTVSDVCP